MPEAIARLKIIYIAFPDGEMLQQLNILISGEFVHFPVLWVQLIVHTSKYNALGERMLNSFEIGKDIFQ